MPSTLEILLEMGFLLRVSRMAAGVLDDADHRGKKTHGSSLLGSIRKRLADGRVRPDVRLTRFDTGTVLPGVDANSTLGYAAAAILTRMCLVGARMRGFSGCIVRNIDHIGALSVYARRGAEANCITLVTASGKPRIAPWGCSVPAFGTSPVSIGIPCGSRPVVVDTSLSRMTVYEVMSRLPARTLPEGVARDGYDKPTVCPREALAGRLMPIGGRKGASLMLAMNLVNHLLSGTAVDDHPVMLLMLRIDDNRVRSLEDDGFLRFVQDIVDGTPGARMPGRTGDV